MASLPDIKIAALPLNICDADKAANLSAAAQMIEKLPGDVDIAVLPELFSTGYVPSADAARSLAECNDGETMAQIRDMAARKRVAVCGSFVASDGDNIYNRAFFVTPDGNAEFYDKRHLFILGEEAKIFSPGTSPMMQVEYKGWRIAVAICFDLRFPEWLRNRKQHPYDALIVPANWPNKRAYAWQHLLIARAIENQAYVVGANRGGLDEFGVYDGLTFVYDYLGRPLADSSEQPSQPVVATFAAEPQARFRASFPVLL